jgi:Tfp pilus assembly protein PilF
MALEERGVEDVAEVLRDNSRHRNSCALLVGAGCSFSAGIPDANGVVELIKSRFPLAYERASAKTYAQCMAKLNTGHRRDLIHEIISSCNKLNWAHLAIAQLVKAAYVDRILTVNFDPLILKACATIGEFPAIYDFVAQHDYSSGRVAEKAAFYLHGQHTGFAILNTDDEVSKQAQRLRPVIRDTAQKRTWIVVGYSGRNDPVFQELEALPSYDHALYWVGYGKEEPDAHVQRLLSRENTFYIRDYTADRFFVELCQRLGCFPPAFVGGPFSHLKSMLDSLADFPGGDIDILISAKEFVADAIVEYEQNKRHLRSKGLKVTKQDRLKAADLYAKRDFVALKKLYADFGDTDDEIKVLWAWALVLEANQLGDQASAIQTEEKNYLYAQAYEKYQQALLIKPDMHEALYNWGNTLDDQARTMSGAEADRLFALAGEKYLQALAIKPDKHKALNNWGSALIDQAKTKSGTEADRLFELAGEKYRQALAIKPDKHDALYNWGIALVAQAMTKPGAEADRLFALAGEKYQQALAIKPDKHEALYNWGIALDDQARTKSGAEADRLFALAGEKYQQALAIKPDKHEALYNWGIALDSQAVTKPGAEADRFFALAGEKYQQALAIKPDKHEALANWGITLADQAKTKSGAEADQLFALAGEKYQQALAIKPDKHEALANWGITLADQARTKTGGEKWALVERGKEVLERGYILNPAVIAYNLACACAVLGDRERALKLLQESKVAGELPDFKHLMTDPDLESLRDSDAFKSFLKETFPEVTQNAGAAHLVGKSPPHPER